MRQNFFGEFFFSNCSLIARQWVAFLFVFWDVEKEVHKVEETIFRVRPV